MTKSQNDLNLENTAMKRCDVKQSAFNQPRKKYRYFNEVFFLNKNNV